MSDRDQAQSPALHAVQIDGEIFNKISNVDHMRPFFMSIVSDSNHWMFIGSNGGISAGRKNAEMALFPYYTDDKIIESAENTGSKSIFKIAKEGKQHVWEPFSIRQQGLYKTSRNLYKSIYGNKIIFEEENHSLGISFQYQWNSSNLFGFVKKNKLTNHNPKAVDIKLLDGIQNIVPYGVASDLQSTRSNLVDAYKRNELFEDSGIGIYALSAFIVDKAEPSESLKANIAWSIGLGSPTHLLSSRQLDQFRLDQPTRPESDVKAERGAYFVQSDLTLPANGQIEWKIVANVNQSISSIVKLADQIHKAEGLDKLLEADIDEGTRQLVALNASADALQLSNDPLKDHRHFSNCLFNIMRGGIFDNNYVIEKNDFLKYLHQANKSVAQSSAILLNALPQTFTLQALTEAAENSDNVDLRRLSIEYLPLKFSRRHGDPSRPWNQFSINTNDEHDGSKILDYEGNWRDIFQNWEALAHSFPAFIDGMIFRFLNASTFDGYNPYRITKNGIDWEKIEADDPWSYIGYWGDHQIIYLLKFLEFSENHYPGKLSRYFTDEVFVYANVPYKIKPYEQLLENSKDTIDFDHQLDREITKQKEAIGADSALLTYKNGQIVRVNFIEKILASLLAKISNFIPEGGIWMNTQRPEWNDANNALVGNGISMVTLYYLIRFLRFLKPLVVNSETREYPISSDLLTCFEGMHDTLQKHKSQLDKGFSDKERKEVLDGLGIAASNFRSKVYQQSFDHNKKPLKANTLADFLDLFEQYLDQTLMANKRADNLYHAYNLMTYNSQHDEISVSYLSEMLEGQVAVLSSGALTSKAALQVLDALKASELFREDQYSYLLYPEKELPGFAEKNVIPKNEAPVIPLLQQLTDNGNTSIVEQDINGQFHFNGSFHNVKDVQRAMDQLDPSYGDLIETDKKAVLQLFEKVFNHKAFTGRSGTFYGYEGLGSIYWHMVSKLLLAVQESCLRAIKEGATPEITGRLLEHYYEINAGIGVHKSPALYGAFPTDPYSHTPKNKGAQQPGMTGQVKEDILCRFGELGVEVQQGNIGFKPHMLKVDEFLATAKTFHYVDVNGFSQSIELGEGMLAFTYCQVPIIYQLADQYLVEVTLEDGSVHTFEDEILNKDHSENIFLRKGLIRQVLVKLDKSILK